jgi:BirA family biotin operon repressor/biotin-[acetyl-CoA-carboxylase] ligase
MRDYSLTEERLSRGLKTRCIAKKLLVFPVLTSTMDAARREAAGGAPEGTAIVAERQTAGRGRLKRTWYTSEGNIAVSIVLYPPKEYLHSLIMLASLTVLNTIETVTGIDCQLKWPNDVLVNGKKVCGILIETKTHIDRLEYAIIGIGINVNMKMDEYPDLLLTATSLSEEANKTFSRATLLRNLFTELERLYLGMLSGKSLYTDWRSKLSTIGKEVRIQSDDLILEGRAESVNEDGSLILKLEDGSYKKITIGDVSLRETNKGG